MNAAIAVAIRAAIAVVIAGAVAICVRAWTWCSIGVSIERGDAAIWRCTICGCCICIRMIGSIAGPLTWRWY